MSSNNRAPFPPNPLVFLSNSCFRWNNATHSVVTAPTIRSPQPNFSYQLIIFNSFSYFVKPCNGLKFFVNKIESIIYTRENVGTINHHLLLVIVLYDSKERKRKWPTRVWPIIYVMVVAPCATGTIVQAALISNRSSLPRIDWRQKNTCGPVKLKRFVKTEQLLCSTSKCVRTFIFLRQVPWGKTRYVSIVGHREWKRKRPCFHFCEMETSVSWKRKANEWLCEIYKYKCIPYLLFLDLFFPSDTLLLLSPSGDPNSRLCGWCNVHKLLGEMAVYFLLYK